MPFVHKMIYDLFWVIATSVKVSVAKHKHCIKSLRRTINQHETGVICLYTEQMNEKTQSVVSNNEELGTQGYWKGNQRTDILPE